ncbi:somatic embryogenesis receptor kinase 2-like [Panicum miliaceum]|uniref:Somatic embryogenesis receptor kinase 2-like n=1 Tax=Panicum miliaceum TaxID=4540 RepID=A0A3L6Q1V2_PANMI|nr:somatic embryogenesis receptor kinase 2-like [Panicum miliaceum]
MVAQLAEAAAAFIVGLVALARLANCNTEGDILYAQRMAWQDSLNVLKSWDPTFDNPCSWEHVTCNTENYVIRLDLGRAGIIGSLVPQLGGLKKLQYLELFENGLNGSIPSTLGNLSNLVNLDLQENMLTGIIPASLGSIGTMINLRLYGNKLSGPIPPSLGNLKNLVSMDLQKNALSGSIPASLGNIKTLRSLLLNNNMLTGVVPSEIISLASVGNLSLVIGMFMLFALLVSYGQLHPYMILISLLPFFSVTLFHRAVTDEVSVLLDHIFDMSAGVYALLAAGCVLGNPYFISKESVAASPLACSLFLTIFIARYLMLISTLRPPVVVEHAETLMFILKLLLALTAIFVTVEFIGWELALVALSFGAVDAVLFSMSLLAHIPGTTTSGDKLSYDQRKEQQLLSAVFVVILFTIIVTKAYSENAAAQEASMGSAAKLGMLLCICAFLCSLNRMLITRADVVVAAPPEGGHGVAKVLSTLEQARASVVAVAALYIIYKIGISAFMGSN